MTEQCRRCGKCLRVCPLTKLGYSSFAVFPVRGPDEADVWQCSNCWLCHLECPQHIDLWDRKTKLQREDEAVPPRIQAGYERLREYGFVFPITEELNVMREDKGLRPLVIPDKEVVKFLLKDE